ncbi:MAG TPA: hypothetical protein VFK50_05610 [Sphingomicrobium sp.]|nr:hypothetical protein [Sphingomicrobium sp.]
MRALILVATAALAVSACSKNDAAENTANLDEMTTENVVVDNTMDANMTMNADANMDMNATNTDMNADANAAANNAM